MGKVYDKVFDFERRFPSGIVWRTKKHSAVIEEYLDKGEKVNYAFCAQKGFHKINFFNTYAVCLTNKRILLGHKRLFWGSFLYSITPDMYNDMKLYKGMLWGKITVDTVKEVITLYCLSKNSLDEIETTLSSFMMKEKKKYTKSKQTK